MGETPLEKIAFHSLKIPEEKGGLSKQNKKGNSLFKFHFHLVEKERSYGGGRRSKCLPDVNFRCRVIWKLNL